MSFDDLARVLTIRPLGTWPDPVDRGPKTSQFDASWSQTVELLASEIGKIRKLGEKAVLQIDITEDKLRLDGLPRADARVGFRGVILTIPTKHGHLRYPCATFDARGYRDKLQPWQHNVRAIALALEALRKVDRYGVTSSGQQYAGWKQLPAPGETTASDQIEVLIATCGADEWSPLTAAAARRSDAEALKHLVRYARATAHPDREDGSHELFLTVQAAAEQLGVA